MIQPDEFKDMKTIENSMFDVRPDKRVTKDSPMFEVVGEAEPTAFSETWAEGIQSQFVGMLRYGDCLKKNKIAFDSVKYMGREAALVVGAMRVWSENACAFYGFNYDPPAEFHAWVEIDYHETKYIIDFALPGVIQRGSISGDSKGSYLIGVKPVVLIGPCPDWLIYKRVMVFERGI